MKDDSHHNAREAILARRAIYLSTALAALGCTPKNTGPKEQNVTGTVTVSALGSASTAPTAKPPKVGAPWKQVMAKAPPLGVPADVSPNEKAQLSALESGMKAQYDKLGKLWSEAPSCDPSAAQCQAWTKLAEKVRTTYLGMGRRGPSPCPGVYGKTGSVVARRFAHQQYIGELWQQLETRFAASARSYGKASAERWQALLAEAKKPPSMPCLSPCRRPPVQDLVASVPFANGAETLRLDNASVKQPLDMAKQRQILHGTRAQLVVRGHADPTEKDPKKLATARARAVANWLVKSGIPKAQIVTKSMAASLPIERSDESAVATSNQRVDFEVIEK